MKAQPRKPFNFCETHESLSGLQIVVIDADDDIWRAYIYQSWKSSWECVNPAPMDIPETEQKQETEG